MRDNGTLATITHFDRDRRLIMIATDTGETWELTATYLARHVEHAYAITGHSSQGATVDAAIVVGRPEEFTREWAYTALSRARQETTIHLIADHGPSEHDRREYAPTQAAREPEDALHALARAPRARARDTTDRSRTARHRTTATPGRCRVPTARTPPAAGAGPVARLGRPRIPPRQARPRRRPEHCARALTSRGLALPGAPHPRWSAELRNDRQHIDVTRAHDPEMPAIERRGRRGAR